MNDPEPADLRHHGDVEVTRGMLDFAVNLVRDRPPRWLADRLAAALEHIAGYPGRRHDAEARAAAALRHGRAPEEVLVLAGAAEGFALLPNLRPRLAALVHPSFTEPEVALRAAGVPVTRVMLDERDGYRLVPERIPGEADLVVLGNPTNPTSVLHPAETIRRIARPGRVIVVDEAFADAVPGEPESLSSACDVPGLLVLRSLTKTWALAGLRAGYALGGPDLLATLASSRPQWPAGTLTLEAVLACCQPEAVAEADQHAITMSGYREQLAVELASVSGVHVHQPAAGPFLLVHVPGGTELRLALRARGIAVRRADTFPGLGPDHLRISVREPERTAALLSVLRTELEAA